LNAAIEAARVGEAESYIAQETSVALNEVLNEIENIMKVVDAIRKSSELQTENMLREGRGLRGYLI
jgi:methyl-accepting chemotaxis protein